MAKKNLRGAVPLCHHFLRERLRPGDRAVDATCGNGNDTVLLAELVGETGRVWAFDIQQRALENTRRMVADAGYGERVEMVAAGHERLAEFVSQPISAAVFNLGYLPGGEKRVTTLPGETSAALHQAAGLLLPGGIITICVYTGHQGGEVEAEAVDGWCAALSPLEFNVWTCRQANRPQTAPYLLIVEKV